MSSSSVARHSFVTHMLYFICLGGSGSSDEHARPGHVPRCGQPNYADPPSDNDPIETDPDVTFVDVAGDDIDAEFVNEDLIPDVRVHRAAPSSKAKLGVHRRACGSAGASASHTAVVDDLEPHEAPPVP